MYVQPNKRKYTPSLAILPRNIYLQRILNQLFVFMIVDNWETSASPRVRVVPINCTVFIQYNYYCYDILQYLMSWERTKVY